MTTPLTDIRRRVEHPCRRAGLLVPPAVLLLALALVLWMPAPGAAANPSFPDVDQSMPAYEAIGFLSSAGIISGYQDGSFGPGDTLKRGQATKMLVLWQSAPMVTGRSTFPDVDTLYRNYVETAVAQGWITGYANGRFKPYTTLTRQQMATIMVRALGWEKAALELSGQQIDQVIGGFSDRARISGAARPYVAMAVSQGLFSGDAQGRLRPEAGITRAQFCLVVYRAELTSGTWVQGVRSSAEHEDKTRVVIDLASAPSKVTTSTSPDGVLIVDFTGGTVWQPILQTIAGSNEVTSVEISQLALDPRTVRATLTLGRYQTVRVMSLAPSEGRGHRVVVDVYRRLAGPGETGPPLICIDPGHGGRDPGALGVSGTPEKAVNLAISLLLAERLRNAGLRVMMTREDDTYPDLRQRAAMANEAGASVFVSIHNNASGNPDSVGTETFYWGSTDQCSPDGRLLAEAIQRNLVAALGSVNRGAKTHWRELVVLTETDMTAALVEVGFMTNALEEANLLTLEYQALAAEAIARGILEYLSWSTTVYSAES